jgi:predicted glycosyltransferase
VIVHNTANTSVSRRMMVYCHDSMGIGHLRRSTAICEHLSGGFDRSSFLIVTGTPYVPVVGLPIGVDYVKLPSIKKNSNGRYSSKTLSVRMQQLLKCRRALLLATVNYFSPTILLVDKTPGGLHGEMIPVLKWIQRNCPDTLVVYGMRDIEDTRDVTRRQWENGSYREILQGYYDETWVYGSRNVFDVAEEYGISGVAREQLNYTGYLARPACTHELRERSGGRHVVVTVGGGTDGEDLIRRYVDDAVHAVAKSGGRSTIVVGPDASPRIATHAKRQISHLPGSSVVSHAECMSCLLRDADFVVSMGGYNTMCEVASWSVPTLIVPRVKPRYEQAIRAKLWYELGVVDVADPGGLTPEKLTSRVMARLSDAWRPDTSGLDLGGMEFIQDRCAAHWKGGMAVETPVRV